MALFDLDDEQETIEPTTLWLFDKRDNSTGQTGWYHGNTPTQVVTQCLLRYTQPGDVVIDPFFGSGTTGFDALRRNRKVIGVELQPGLASHIDYELRNRYPHKQDQFLLITGDCLDTEVQNQARQQIQQWNAPCTLLFLHPPYHDMIQFSSDTRCLSNCGNLDNFLRQWQRVLNNWVPFVKPGGGVAIVIGDMVKNSEWIPLGFRVLDVALSVPNLKLRAICIKNIRDNAAKRGKEGLWRHLARTQNLFIFGHEYVFLLDVTAPTSAP